MNDPLKDFVKNNREAFDNLEPRKELSNKILEQLKQQKETKKVTNTFTIKSWSIAASVLLVFGLGTFIYLTNNKPDSVEIVQHQSKKTTIKNENQLINKKPSIDSKLHKNDLKITQNSINNQSKIKSKTNDLIEKKSEKSIVKTTIIEDSEKQTIIRLIKDTESASNRLNGIIIAGNQTELDQQIIDLLAYSASEDNNSNVRLAAVELLATQADQPKVAEKIIETFIKQDDPVVQVELINLLAKMDNSINNKEVQQKLLSLTNDPTTWAYVKDEAYVAMMYN